MGAAPPSPEDLAARLIELVDIPSVSGDEQKVLDHISALMPASFEAAYEGDAVAYFSPAVRKSSHTVVLTGHTDTVPVSGNLPSRRVGDTVFGRGTADMKAGLAVMVELARWIDANPDAVDVDVAFLFFGREELSSEHSALLPALRESDEIREASFAILMEPTANALELGCQGNLNLTVVYHGSSAHSARPWTGVNAAHRAVSSLQKLAVLEPREVEIDGLVFREVAGITAVRGGIARNVVPDRVEVDVNVRYPPSLTPVDAVAKWTEYFAGEGVDVEVSSNAPPAPVVREHALARRLTSAGATSIRPKQAWTNAADFAGFGMPAVNFGPGDPELAHTDDESVDIAALVESFAVLRRFVTGEEA